MDPTAQGRDPLKWLLGDQASDFLTTAYEQKPVVVRHGDPRRFSSLLSIAAIDRIVAERDLRQGMLIMANATNAVDEDAYVTPAGTIDRAAVANFYRKGGTIILNQLQEQDLALAEFCHSLERIFSCHVQTNIYQTPPSNQGFHTHYDKHDVFILQIEGEKTWRLYDQAPSPYRGEGFQREEVEGQEARETFVLGPGDCAYVPRGKIHDAMTTGDVPSLHITCGLIVRTWAELMLEAVSEVCVDEPAFRKSLPADFALPSFDRAAARREFAAMIGLIAEKAQLDNALDLMTDVLIRSREPNMAGAVLRAMTPVDGRYKVSSTLWRFDEPDEDGMVRMIAPNGDVTFRAELQGAVDRMLSGEVFDAADFAEEATRTVLERLLARGVVAPVQG